MQKEIIYYAIVTTWLHEGYVDGEKTKNFWHWDNAITEFNDEMQNYEKNSDYKFERDSEISFSVLYDNDSRCNVVQLKTKRIKFEDYDFNKNEQ